jgi:hypothetical protein
MQHRNTYKEEDKGVEKVLINSTPHERDIQWRASTVFVSLLKLMSGSTPLKYLCWEANSTSFLCYYYDLIFHQVIDILLVTLNVH